MHPYYSFLIKRRDKKTESDKKFRDDIGKELDKALAHITENYKTIERIIIFGSFIEGGFNRFSDLDIYAEGLCAEDYFEVKRTLEDIIGLEVDLFNNGDKKEFIESIKKRGLTVYERKTRIADSKSS